MTVVHNESPLIRLEDVHKHFPLGGTMPWSRSRVSIRAVDGVSLEIQAGETLSLAGESGCGKTTIAKLVLRLERPTAGHITFSGNDIRKLTGRSLRHYHASVQAVFQDPWSSLNPRMRVGTIVGEPLAVIQRLPRSEVRGRVTELLEMVGLNASTANNFPHELSGGMRQRVAVARALSVNPSVIILDEPVSALDVSIRAQIVNLIKDLQDRYGVAYLLITHDLATVRYVSDRVAIMYAGQIVETGLVDELFTNPLHPYTKALLSAALPAHPKDQREEILLGGEPPSPTQPPSGCRFHPRCPVAFDRCSREVPKLMEMASGSTVACHLYTEKKNVPGPSEGNVHRV